MRAVLRVFLSVAAFRAVKMFGRDSGSGGSNAGCGAGMSSGAPPVEIDPRARPDGAINSQRSNNLVEQQSGLVSSGGDHYPSYQHHQQQPQHPHYTKGLTDQQLHEQQQLIQQQLLQQQQHKLQQVGVMW